MVIATAIIPGSFVSLPEIAPSSGPTREELQQRIADLVEAVAARDTFIAVTQ
jgi:hypothetical protein